MRVAINWSSSAGIRPVNVFHLITSSQNEFEIGEALDEAFTGDGEAAFTPVMENFTIESWSITNLGGSNATQIIPSGAAISGGTGGNIVPQVAGVLSMRTNIRGSRGRGRLYLGPAGETNIDAGLWALGVPPGTVAGWLAAAESLADNPLNISFGVASYVHEEVAGVSSFSMRRAAGTQRRRQNQVV